MSFLPDEDLESLSITQSVFHIVGPGKEHFRLLEAFDATPHADFFLARIRSLQSANSYEFLSDASVRTKLSRIDKGPNVFQKESEELAATFDEAHRGSSAVGAFLLFVLKCKSGKIFALLKFEDETVLSYDFKESGGTSRPKPSFGEISKTFVQNRSALQKAALIRLGNASKSAADEVWVIDRQNPQRPAAYFEQFLGVRRLRSEGDLTKALINITNEVARKHKDLLPENTLANLSKRLYDASRSGGSVDGEKIDDWLKSIVGPLPDESPIIADLKTRLRRERILGESFNLDKTAVPAPRNRRVETKNGIRIIFPAGLQKSVIDVNRGSNLITIRDKIEIDDYEIEATRRTR